MAIYSIARTATITTTNNAAADIASPTASGVRARVMEAAVTLGAATASTYGINRPSTLGTRTTPVAALAEDPADQTLTGITLVDSAIAFSAQPTLGSADYRIIALPATIGTGMVWTFPRGIVLGVQGSLAIVNRATNSASAPYYFIVDV